MQEVGSGSISTPRTGKTKAHRRTLFANTPPEKFLSAPRTRNKTRVILRKVAFGFAAFLSAALLSSIYASDANRMRLLSNAIPEIDTAISLAGFGLQQVSLRGQRFALASDIFDALELDKATTFASLDAAAARKRIEAISWVSTAELRRIYPGQLNVLITERKPFAVWRDGSGTTSLVDKEGRILSAIAAKDAPAGLARIEGTGAPAAAAELWADLARYPAIANLIDVATRVSDRRWSLRMTNGVRLELPSGAVIAALHELNDWPGLTGLNQQAPVIVDLRTPGRIAIRPIEPFGKTSASPKNISELLEPAG